MRRKKIYIVFFIMISIVVLGIGYASIANINLIVNGSLSSVAQQSNFDVKFLSTGANAPTIQGSPTNAVTVTSNTTASFNITSLVEKDDSVTATLKVKNESNNVGARIALNLTNSNREYFKVTEHIDDTELKVGDIATVTVTVEMIKTAFENNQTANIVATLIVSPIEEVTATGSDSNSVVFPLWTLPAGRTATTLQAGDELQLKDQSFYFIRYDENNKAVLLAKYNLNVGNNPKGGVETFLQDSDVRGEMDGYTTYGTVNFSGTEYWLDENNHLKSPYNENNTIYYTNSHEYKYFSDDTIAYPTVYDSEYSGYSIAYYVEEYKSILEGVGYGAIIDDARLLLYSEASNLTGVNAISSSTSILIETSFWLGSASQFDNIAFIGYNHAECDIYNFNCSNYYGVRPVLVISPSNL